MDAEVLRLILLTEEGQKYVSNLIQSLKSEVEDLRLLLDECMDEAPVTEESREDLIRKFLRKLQGDDLYISRRTLDKNHNLYHRQSGEVNLGIGRTHCPDMHANILEDPSQYMP